MSHFRQIQTQLKSTAALVAALVELGFSPLCHAKAREDLIEYQAQREKLGKPRSMPDLSKYISELDQPQICWSYDGERRYDDDGNLIVGDIVISRDQVGSCSNDVGFKWDAKGSYTFLRSEYDTRSGKCSDRHNFLFNLKSNYGYYTAHEMAREIGGEVVETKSEAGFRQFRITRTVHETTTRSTRVATSKR
jgi:Protein of unknown function (DUF1257)